MRTSINILNVMAMVWLVPLCIPYFIEDNPIIAPVGGVTVTLVVSSIFVLFLFYFFFWIAGVRGRPEDIFAALKKINFFKFSRKVNLIFMVWAFLYLINIFGSGGFPLLWVLQGDPRTYVDFGLPTLGGLVNMLRAFALTACYILFFHSDLSIAKKRNYLYMGVFLIISAFLLETGRGNGVVLILHPLGLHFLLSNFRIIGLVKWILASLAFLFMLGVVQLLRYADGFEKIMMYAENSGFHDATIIEALMIPSVMYISVPIINTDLNVQLSDVLKFQPYYSLQGLLPTVIRDAIFERGDYGFLVNEANNVSSYFIPFIRDFGSLGAFFAVAIILFIAAYCYARARQGSLFFILSYPPIFMSVSLSFFSLFFTSLVVVLYPFLVSWALKGVLHKK
jgi:oligosaccharide repeat unit polymerase